MRLPCLVLLLIAFASAQETRPVHPETSCTPESVLDAGNKTDKQSGLWLRRMASSGSCADLKLFLEMALAKRGDPQRQKDIVCHVLSATPGVASELEYVGGWFGIRGSFLLMDQETAYWIRKKRARKASDIIFRGSPRIWALKALSKIVKEPPTDTSVSENSSAADLDKAEKSWRNWLQDNKNDLENWNPRGSAFPTQSQCIR